MVRHGALSDRCGLWAQALGVVRVFVRTIGLCSTHWLPLRLSTGAVVGIGLLLSVGCASTSSAPSGPMVIFLDGAGWSGSERSVRAGLHAAGFTGHVEAFTWSSRLGPVPDHFLVGHKKRRARQLVERVVQRRARYPECGLHLMGLSAGSGVIVFALEQLPDGVDVDNVVLFSPSISAKYDLSSAMEHVRGCLYATSSPRDGILGGLRINADGKSGHPAGLYGLRIPSRVKRYDLYTRVVNLPWRAAYADLGWNGSHTGATGQEFVERMIAPRILAKGPQPLNRPLAPRWIGRWRGDQGLTSSQQQAGRAGREGRQTSALAGSAESSIRTGRAAEGR